MNIYVSVCVYCIMTNKTKRDQIWISALAQAIRGDGRVTPTGISKDTDVSKRTCRETLVVISQNGWLERRTHPDGSVYYTGPRDIVARQNMGTEQ